MNPANKWLVGLLGGGLLTGAVVLEGDYNKHLDPYKDIVGIPTVCSGHTGKDVIMGQKWTPEACKAQLDKDLGIASKGILECVTVPLNVNQYNALTLFAMNIGVPAFCKSNTVLKPLNQGKYEEAAKGMYKWVYAGGIYSKGLYNRRVKEYKIFHGDYSDIK